MNIKSFTDTLTNWGLEWAILGGYPRDLHHGVEPKDLDIIIYNTDYISKGQLRDIMEELAPNLITSHEASMCGSPRLIKVITYNIEGTTVDLIFWNGIYDTLQKVVDNFDFNINQYILDPTTMQTKFLGKNEGVVEIINSEAISLTRRLRIESKAKELRWKLDEKEFEVPCPF